MYQLTGDSSPLPGFYVVGGTLERDAPSYVPRQADDTLYASLEQGHFCYILTARQMGKSSLMVRTAVRLRRAGHTPIVVDLTQIGQNLTVDQWYKGLLGAIGESTGLEDELRTHWRTFDDLGPLQRLMKAIREVVVPRSEGRVVIFVDEIDTVRSLPFSTDEFFAGIREIYNRRTVEPELNRLAFCLLGVASPSDLIQDTRMTPFNIGRRIELNDFRLAEALPLARGLSADSGVAEALLERVLHWTGGHPYLTQRLCQAVAESEFPHNLLEVDRLCTELFLSPRARERDDNLLFVRDRILRTEVDLTSLLELYREVYRGERVEDDETNPLISVLRLSGITRVETGRLAVRNRIYQAVFDLGWIEASMPDADRRRQRRAFLRGLGRAAAASLVVIAALVFAIVFTTQQLNTAEQERDLAEAQQAESGRLLYATHLELIYEALRRGDEKRATQLIEEPQPVADRLDDLGFEFLHPWRVLHGDSGTAAYPGHSSAIYATAYSRNGDRLATASLDGTIGIWDTTTWQQLAVLSGHTASARSVSFSPDGRSLVSGGDDGLVLLWDLESGTSIDLMMAREGLSIFKKDVRVFSVAWSPAGDRIAASCFDGALRLWDARSRALVHSLALEGGSLESVAFSPGGDLIAAGGEDTTVGVWAVATGKRVALLEGHTDWVNALAFSPDGSTLVTAGSYLDTTVRLWNTSDWTVHYVIEKLDDETTIIPDFAGHQWRANTIAFAPGGSCIAMSTTSGRIHIYDPATGQPFGRLQPDPKREIVGLSFAPDGRTLACGVDTGELRLYFAAPRADAVARLRG